MPTDAAKSVAPVVPVVVNPTMAPPAQVVGDGGGFGRPDTAAAFAQAQQSAVLAIDRAAAAATAAVRSAADQAALTFTDIQHRVLDRLAEQERRAAAADAALASRLDTLAELIARAETITRRPTDKNATSLRDLVERAESAEGQARFAAKLFDSVRTQADTLRSDLGEAVVSAAEAADSLVEERGRMKAEADRARAEIAQAIADATVAAGRAETTRHRLSDDVTAIADALSGIAVRAGTRL